MQIAQTVGDWLLQHWPDIVVAIVLAAIADLLRIGSFVRSSARHIKNRLAEQSAGRLRKRIAQLQTYRDALRENVSSDKALYLGTLRFIIAVLLFMCIAGMLLIMYHLRIVPNGDIGALFVLAFAVGIGTQALRLAGLDTKHKLSDFIGKLDRDISALQDKLRRRTH
jgi:hypothetical protein